MIFFCLKIKRHRPLAQRSNFEAKRLSEPHGPPSAAAGERDAMSGGAMTAPPSALVVVQGDHVAWAAMAGWNTIAVEQDYIIHYTMKPNCFVSFIASSKGMPPSSPTSVPSTNRDALCREELHLTPSPARTSS